MEIERFLQDLLEDALNLKVEPVRMWKGIDPKLSLIWHTKCLLAQAEMPKEERDSVKIRSSWSAVKQYGVKLGVFEKFKGNNVARESLKKFLSS